MTRLLSSPSNKSLPSLAKSHQNSLEGPPPSFPGSPRKLTCIIKFHTNWCTFVLLLMLLLTKQCCKEVLLSCNLHVLLEQSLSSEDFYEKKKLNGSFGLMWKICNFELMWVWTCTAHSIDNMIDLAVFRHGTFLYCDVFLYEIRSEAALCFRLLPKYLLQFSPYLDKNYYKCQSGSVWITVG